MRGVTDSDTVMKKINTQVMAEYDLRVLFQRQISPSFLFMPWA